MSGILSPKSVPGGNSGGFFTTQHEKPVRGEGDVEITRGADGQIISVARGNGKRNTAILKDDGPTPPGGIPG